MEQEHRPSSHVPLTPRMALDLAAPHTWPAAIMPALAAIAAASGKGPLSISMTLVLLAIVVLMQASVNTFNDYYDFVKGADSASDNVEASDAVLVYNDVNPRHALALAIGFLVAAFALGSYAIAAAGPAPLIIALIGAAFVVLYSAGSSPISYLPLGEFVSGFVMGGLIPLAVYQVLTGTLDFTLLVIAIPTMIGVALIMFTNNTCDIERDLPTGRRTLPIVLGRSRARLVYRVAIIAWLVTIIANVGIFYPTGLIVLPFALLAAYPLLKPLFNNPFTASARLAAMPQALTANVVLGAFYAAAIFASSGVVLIW